MTIDSSFEKNSASGNRSSTESFILRVSSTDSRRMCKDHAVARSGNHLELDLEVNLVQTETFWLVTKSGAIGKMSSGKCTTNRATGVESHYLKWKNMELFMNASTQTVKHCSKYKNLGFLPPQKETLPCQARPTLCDYSEVKRCSKLCRYSPLFLRPSKLLSCQRVWVPTGHKQFTQAADVAEKLLVQRLFHKSILMFNNYNTSDKLQGGKGCRVARVFDLVSSETSGRNVSCISWNKELPDILVAGHGEIDYPGQHEGLVSCWSLKSPTRAIWTAVTASGVTAVDFSATKPNSLAIGLQDGSIFIVDISTKAQKTENANKLALLGQHSDPVWQVRWVRRKLKNDEILVSISTDGRIIQWDVSTQGEQLELMSLGGVNLRAGRGKSVKHVSGGNVHNNGKGTCFDFSYANTSVYVVGMENGMLHRCSSSSSEQYLNSYLGHSGPVYQVRWAYHVADVFISASADWTIKLWRERSFQPIFTFSNGEQMSDVCWSPSDSAAFACSTMQGKLEVWDMSISILEPVAIMRTCGTMSCASFSTKMPAIATGGVDGMIRLFCVPDGSPGSRLANPISKLIHQQASSFNNSKHLGAE